MKVCNETNQIKRNKKEKTLKEEALEIVDNIGIINYLNNYGRVEVVGSVALDLILNKDIDIHLLTNYNRDQVCKNTIQFLNSHQIYDIRIEEYKSKYSNCIIINYCNDWNIEIWISNNENYVGFKLKEDLEKLLNNETRCIIMKLKTYYNNMNLLYGEMSTYIYKGVVYNRVQTISEFKEYISNKNL